LVPALPGLPDMVFSAYGATVIDGKVLVARFHHPERRGETQAYVDWSRARVGRGPDRPRSTTRARGICCSPGT
jgi:N-dimethylarginine dimethylaminohydrolase